MKSLEHRAVGQAAARCALVQFGADSAEARFVLSYGDVVALSGDYFTSHDLFRLAAIPGERGTKLATREEIICALKVMAVDGAFVDARFEPGGEFSDFRFTRLLGLPRSNDGSGTATWPWPWPSRTATISSRLTDPTPLTTTRARSPAASAQPWSPIAVFMRWLSKTPAGWDGAGG